MFKIKDITVKNFLSVGNQTQAVDFAKEHLTLVLGENVDLGGDDSGSRNGTGKTTIVNALSYALYGQALTNIKKDNLINKTNGKHMLVTIDFEVENQKPITVYYEGESVGNYYADIVVNDNLIIELKAVNKLLDEHYSQ